MSEQPEPGNNTNAWSTSGTQPESGSRRRIWVSLVVLYISAGFLLTFTLRTQWIMPVPGHTDFLDALLNPRIYLSALFWPFWLLWSLF